MEVHAGRYGSAYKRVEEGVSRGTKSNEKTVYTCFYATYLTKANAQLSRFTAVAANEFVLNISNSIKRYIFTHAAACKHAAPAASLVRCAIRIKTG